MKKEYIQPEMTVLTMETEGMIASSPSSVNFDGNGNGTANMNYRDATDNAESKLHRFDVWGLDEEE